MHQRVPHILHLSPRQPRICDPDVLANVPGCFADGREVPQHRIDANFPLRECFCIQPLVYRRILSMLSRMSSTRKLQLLGGTNRFSQDLLLELGIERIGRSKIHARCPSTASR